MRPAWCGSSADKQQLIGVRTDVGGPGVRVASRAAGSRPRRRGRAAALSDHRGGGRLDPDARAEPGRQFRDRKQQVLATYYAQNLISAVQTYVFALQTNAQALSGDATIGYQRGTTVLSLQVALDSLRALGMSEFQIGEIERTRLAPTEIRVYSPIDGFVTARNITPEQRFDKGTELYRIADIGHVWVMAEIFERDSAFLKPGTRATVLYQGRQARGAHERCAAPVRRRRRARSRPASSSTTRATCCGPTCIVDVELHADMPAALTVPADAVVDSGVRKTVYVDRGDGYFEARRVETGWRVGDRVQITKGLMPGERVVVSGNFLLDSESRMKSAAMGIFNPETDPVCGMDVDRNTAKNAGRTVVHNGSTYFFCSDDCKHKFEANPGSTPRRGRRRLRGRRRTRGAASRHGMAGMTAAEPGEGRARCDCERRGVRHERRSEGRDGGRPNARVQRQDLLLLFRRLQDEVQGRARGST